MRIRPPALALAALAALAAQAPGAAATPWKALQVPIGAGYLADSGDAASSGRVWQRSTGKITDAPDGMIIKGMRADGTAVAYAPWYVYTYRPAADPQYAETPWIFATYAQISPAGGVAPFHVELHDLPHADAGTTYRYLDAANTWQDAPATVDWHDNGVLWQQAWKPMQVTPSGRVLWAVQRDQFDEYGVSRPGDSAPSSTIFERAHEFTTTYGVDESGRIAYTTYDDQTNVLTAGLTDGPTLTGVCMRSLSADGYLLVSLPESCSSTRGLRLYKPDGTVAWERSVADLPPVDGPYLHVAALRGGLVAGTGTDRSYEVFIISASGARVDVAKDILPGLPAGARLTAVFDANRRRELLAGARLASGDSATYILTQRTPITGSVVDPAGAPLTGALITASPVPTTGARAAAKPVTARTDAKGRFSLDVDWDVVVVSVQNGCFGRTAGKGCTRTVRVDLTKGAPAPLVARADRAARPVAAPKKGVQRLVVRRGKAPLALRCLRVTGPCAVNVAVAAKGVRLAGGTATIPAAGLGKVSLKLTRAGATRVGRGAVVGTATVRVGRRSVTIPVRLAKP